MSRKMTDEHTPLLLVVTGPPASGKTTIARAVARELALPLFAKDELKEALFDSLGTGDRAWSRRLGGAVFELLYAIAEAQLSAGCAALLEANFVRGTSEPAFAALPSHRLVQIHCSAPEHVLLERYRGRRRHAGHLDDALVDDVVAAIRDARHDPLALAGDLIEIDTSPGTDAARASIARRVRTRGGGHSERMARPLLLVVTGPPATGKTKVAEELAERLQMPFILKDTLKERLYEVFGSGDELEEKVEQAALAILFSVIDSQLAAGVSVVAESNFDARFETEPFRRLRREHDVRLIQVHCSKPPHEVARHFAERAASGRRHPGHGDRPEDAQEVVEDVESGRWDALDLPGELIEVDVDELDYDVLVRRLRRD